MGAGAAFVACSRFAINLCSSLLSGEKCLKWIYHYAKCLSMLAHNSAVCVWAKGMWKVIFDSSLIYYAIMTMRMEALEADSSAHVLIALYGDERVSWWFLNFSTETLWNTSTRFGDIWMSREHRSRQIVSNWSWIDRRTRVVSSASKSQSFTPMPTVD